MGNKQEEEILEKEINNLEDREMEINLQLYKLQQEINNRVPKEEQKKLKKNYEHIIDKIKNIQKSQRRKLQKTHSSRKNLTQPEKPKKNGIKKKKKKKKTKQSLQKIRNIF